MATKTKRSQTPVRRPEYKIGPFHNGLGIAVWSNSVDTEKGPRYFRSVSLAPRRYRDAQTGEWKDATSYRPVDLSTLILALQEARRFCSETPLPGQALEGDELEGFTVLQDGEIVPNGQPSP